MTTLSKDKFLVMCMELTSDASTSLQDITDLWKVSVKAIFIGKCLYVTNLCFCLCDLQVTSSNSANVEQHRLKCWPAVSYTTTDSSKNGNLLNGTTLDNYGGGDRQMHHLSSTVR